MGLVGGGAAVEENGAKTSRGRRSRQKKRKCGEVVVLQLQVHSIDRRSPWSEPDKKQRIKGVLFFATALGLGFRFRSHHIVIGLARVLDWWRGGSFRRLDLIAQHLVVQQGMPPIG